MGRTIAPQAVSSASGDAAVESELNVAASYDGSEPIYRLLRLETWGSPLMNLGFYRFWGPLYWLNLTASLEEAQRRLVLQTVGLLAVEPGQRVLDVACGRGMSSYLIHCLHPQAAVVGLDLLERHTDAARTLYGGPRGLSYVAGDAMLLDFPDASFDRVMCLEAAFHFPDRSRFLQEAFRVLRPGGRAVVVDFAWNTEADRARRDDPETRIVRRIWQWDDFATVPEYDRMAQAAGFRIASARDWSPRSTGPTQFRLRCVGFLGKTRLGRALLVRKNPLFRSFLPEDWEACAATVAAHDYVQRHSKYMAYVFEKPA